ncbi:MAG TPA: carbohydrate ABC transporter permease [Tepidisphaeraceae bacterium]|jgi:cellobiose transport system permease protein|nr:carbohydrate ABC transporter permease [Tepidisphaeraceae bacterium]
MPTPPAQSVPLGYLSKPPLQPRISARKQGNIWGSIWIYLLLILIAAVFAAPFYWLFVCSISTRDKIFALPPHVIPVPPVWENFSDVFKQTTLFRAFLNSTVIALAHVSVALVLCSLAGYAFAKFPKAPGNRWLFAAVLATMMIPGAVTMIPVFVVLARLHLVNTYWAMILPGAASAFGIFWMRQYIISNVPDDLLSAARIDGCGEWGIYWQIVLPVIRPALGALGILLLIGSWNNLMWAFIVLRSEDMYTLPLLIYLLNGEDRTPYGMLMAAGLLATLPLVIAFLFFQRSFISGITAGAVKS